MDIGNLMLLAPMNPKICRSSFCRESEREGVAHLAAGEEPIVGDGVLHPQHSGITARRAAAE